MTAGAGGGRMGPARQTFRATPAHSPAQAKCAGAAYADYSTVTLFARFLG